MHERHHSPGHRHAAVLGLLFLAPALWFVTANVLKYRFGFLAAWDILPLHPAVLLGGIAAALVMNAWSLSGFEWERRGSTIRLHLDITWRAWNVLVLLMAGLSLLALLGYAVAENLTHATLTR